MDYMRLKKNDIIPFANNTLGVVYSNKQQKLGLIRCIFFHNKKCVGVDEVYLSEIASIDPVTRNFFRLP